MTQPKKTAEEMLPLIERYLAGHLSQKAFCNEYGLSLAQLNYWIAKYRRQGATPRHEPPSAFFEISPAAAPGQRVSQGTEAAPARKKPMRQVLPSHLPSEVIVIESEEDTCC